MVSPYLTDNRDAGRMVTPLYSTRRRPTSTGAVHKSVTCEELRRLVGVEPITTFIRSGRLRWYGHMMRKGDEDWVKKCMEHRVEGRRPIGRPRNF